VGNIPTVFRREDIGHYGQGELRRRSGANVQADRGMQSRQEGLRDPSPLEFLHILPQPSPTRQESDEPRVRLRERFEDVHVSLAFGQDDNRVPIPDGDRLRVHDGGFHDRIRCLPEIRHRVHHDDFEPQGLRLVHEGVLDVVAAALAHEDHAFRRKHRLDEDLQGSPAIRLHVDFVLARFPHRARDRLRRVDEVHAHDPRAPVEHGPQGDLADRTFRASPSQSPADNVSAAGDEDLEAGLGERRAFRLRYGGDRECLPPRRELVQTFRVFRRLHEKESTAARNLPFASFLGRRQANKPTTLARDVASRGRRKGVRRVSPVPFGLGFMKPHNYREVFRSAWNNKRRPFFTWRILHDGVCDGCALGTTGLRDFTMEGIHLCTVRLDLLPLNTMGPLRIRRLADVGPLRTKSSKELRELGRLPYPMVRHHGDRGFRRIPWEDALQFAARRIRATSPDRLAFFVTSRGMTNESYYVANKVARFLGTNHIDNSSRPCHSPSTAGLKDTIGVAASTCSYSDWIGSDLIVFFGSDVPNNQPVTMKYLYYAKKQGTRVAVVNPMREPGLERYWVPSVPGSALFGTRFADEFFAIHTGGDIGFINGVLKHLIENRWVDEDFIEKHTTGFYPVRVEVVSQTWEQLEQQAGVSKDRMLDFARMYHEAKSAIFVWSMGITHHRFGVDNVKSIVNLGLARGIVGREKCGLMPIRGHSGVQGGSEMGAQPAAFGLGFPVDDENADRFAKIWGFRPPTMPGMTAVGMIDAAHERRLDVLYLAGGNFLETLPEPEYVRTALECIPLRIHQDLVLTSQMLVEPEETVLLFPAQTRYEQRGGGTETSTERRVYFSPEIPGRRIGESRPEWELFMDLAERSLPDSAHLVHFDDAAAIRREIAKAIPTYQGIEKLSAKGDAFQYGGPRLCEGGVFPMPDGRARFSVMALPDADIPPGQFLLSTRRGKQFNSMIHGEVDFLLGARRSDVLISAEDAKTLGVADQDEVLISNDLGSYRGQVHIAPIRPRNVQIYWPEGNVLIRRGVVDPQCEMPDYNALVRIAPAAAAAAAKGNA